jgi:hypothetical protein
MVALRIGATIGALLGKYATEKVFASGGIDAPDRVYFTVHPLAITSNSAYIANIALFIVTPL